MFTKVNSLGPISELNQVAGAGRRQSRRTGGRFVADHVDFSKLAKVAAQAVDELRIAQIKAEIAAGTYITDGKLDVVAGRLYTALKSETPCPQTT